MRGWNAIDENAMVAIKGGLAAAGALLLAWGWWLARRGRPDAHRRLRDRLLATAGVLGALCYFNLGHFHFNHYLHIWDQYHYYIGAKYFPELEYTRLYECTAAVEIEEGLVGRVAQRKLRNLSTNLVDSTAAIVADPSRCIGHFTPARWASFRHDVTWFRMHSSLGYWNDMQRDHGYNGTPVWGMTGALVAHGPASDRQVLLLGLLDPLLLAIMWGFIAWAFGWRAMCVGLLYWGTNYPSRYYWNGGAFLRMDWLALSAIGVCLLKRERPGAAGFALTWAALLRVFPAFLVVPLILKAGISMWRAKRLTLSREHRRFAIGAVAALALLVPLSGAATGAGAWSSFVENSAKHLHTPLTNNMGLKTVLAFTPSTRAEELVDRTRDDPFDIWKAARLYAAERTRVPYLLFVLAFVLLVARAAGDAADWLAAALGVMLIPVATELTCYYYSILLIPALIWVKRPLAGALMAALAALSCLVPAIRWWDDERFFVISALTVAAMIAIVVEARRAAPMRAETVRTAPMRVEPRSGA